MRYEDGLGGHIDILEPGDDDQPMRFRMLMPKGFGPPAPESHPNMREDFLVLRGTLDLGKVDGTHVVLHAGDTFTLPAGCFHLPANRGDEELEFESTLTPGRKAAAMFAALYTETYQHRGIGQFARVAMAFRRHADIISFPLPVRVAMTVVAAFARLLGIRPTPVERSRSAGAQRPATDSALLG